MTPEEIAERTKKADHDVSTSRTNAAALEAAIAAAESFMAAMKLASSPTEKKTLDQHCRRYVQLAESLKTTSTWHPPQSQTVAELKVPESNRELTKREQIILLEGSKLNGFIFPPWKAPPEPAEFELADGMQPFKDSSDLKLSEIQMDYFVGWKRIPDMLLEMATYDELETSSQSADLVQDVASDCSVVASICAGVARSERGHPLILPDRIYPYDVWNRRPPVSASGKYVLKFHFNGCFRKVLIDDRLPCSRSSRALHVIDRRNPRLLWPALIEKAYLKVRGGYDFLGSNSGTDLFVLTGWIPEQIFLQDSAANFTYEGLWKRVFSAFGFGDVMCTLGTGNLSQREQAEAGLIAKHDYAVLDLKEEEGRRVVLVKNPWSDGSVWKGALIDPQPDKARSENAKRLQPGTFWMDFDGIFQYFENLYLNWNPGLFTHRADNHFTWKLSDPRTSPGCFIDNPQFAIRSQKGGTVWLLLNRHFKTGDFTAPGDSHQAGFISVYLFKNNGHRVLLSHGSLQRAPYVDSPNVLLTFEIPPNTTYTAAVAEQSMPSGSHNFSLSTFSRHSLTVTPAHNDLQHVQYQQSQWTLQTAGGNADNASYTTNPQFSLHITAPTKQLSLLLQTPEDAAVHVKLFWISRDKPGRIHSVRARDIIAESGDYKLGCAVIELGRSNTTAQTLSPGYYTIIPSTFTPRQLGQFTLRISAASQSFTLKSLPQESSGRLSILASPAVFAPGVSRLLAPLTTTRLTRLRIIAKHISSSHSHNLAQGARSPPCSPLLLTLEQSQGPYKHTLASSSPQHILDNPLSPSLEDNEPDPQTSFSDAATGVRIEDLDVRPEMGVEGGLWIVVRRLCADGDGEGSRESVQIEVLCDERVSVGSWGVGGG